MARNYSRMTPDQLVQAMRDFAAYATANLVATGLQAADVAAVTTASDALDAGIDTWSQAQEAAKAATAARNSLVDAGAAALDLADRKVLLKPDLTAETMNGLGIPIRDTTPTTTPPSVPLDLVVTPAASGTNTLKWAGNGNKTGTQYIIEIRTTDTGSFTYLATTTRRTFEDAGRGIGLHVAYRVRAQRAGIQSDWSVVVAAYE